MTTRTCFSCPRSVTGKVREKDATLQGGKRGSTADAHLRLGRGSEQRGDGMAKTFQTQIDLAQSVKEEQPGADGIMLEFSCDKIEG